MRIAKHIRLVVLIFALAGLAWATDAERSFTKAELDYWAYKKVQKPAVPALKDRAGVKNAIDAFIQKALDAKQIRMSPPADKTTLLRRATFDLIGLPPTPEETQAFLADPSPDAFAKVIDRLLASPHYGEKWARHWLDLARYAESEGFKSDETRPNVWRYRDYVIKSFNEDKPYDRFIKEQLAGDELWPDNPAALVATGFNRHYPDESNARNLKQRRQEILNDVTDTVGAVFLGTTYGCARCHDHKFDPILQKDYYKLQAFFAGVRSKDNFVLASAAEKADYDRRRALWEEKTKDLREQIARLEAPVLKSIYEENFSKYPPEIQEAVQMSPEQRGPMHWLMYYKASWLLDSNADEDGNGVGKRLKGDARKQWDALRAQLATFDDIKPKPLPIGSGITDVGPVAPSTHVLSIGVYDAPLEEVSPGFLTILQREPAKIIPPARSATTGRRTALANWLTDPGNPLVARVMANRLWHYHFSRGLVETPSDFGSMGETDTNRPLLDYLAATFVEKGWSIKAMHRLIMLSATYQQSSELNREAIKRDSRNDGLWRFPRRRLSGEEIRDAILFTGGQLNLQMGGPSVFPDIPEGMEVRGGWKKNEKEEAKNRRSIYVFVRRNSRFPLFQTFDMPDTHESCARRVATTTAPQALALLNDKALLKAAQAFAGRVLKLAGDNVDAQMTTAYRLAFLRTPDTDERALVTAFLQKQSESIRTRMAENRPVLLPVFVPDGMDPARAAALVDFCHALFNANEFVYVN